MFSSDQTVLLVIDVQGKLAHLMHEKEIVFKNVKAMIKGAQILGIPILWTEQVPEKIGNTIPQIAQLLKDQQPVEKESFSCVSNKRFMEALSALNRKQIVVTGIEGHVCVYQTAADLISEGYQLQIVCDAVSSRSLENKQIALERLKQLGAQMTCTEMILCELLKTTEDKRFKEILKLMN